MQLTSDHLKYGSLKLLAEITGIRYVQLSGWFNSRRFPSDQNVQKIAQAMRIDEQFVRQAILDRRAERDHLRILNRDLKNFRGGNDVKD